MDIDEFLDREYLELALSKTPEKPVQTAGAITSENLNELLERIKSNIASGNFDEADSSYKKLWRLFAQHELKWNEDTYNKLSDLIRQTLSRLNQAYSELKRKSGQIYELISRARSLLKEGKKHLALTSYNDAQAAVNSIPNVFFEEKKIVQDQLVDLYKDLKNATDNEILKSVITLVSQITQLIDKIRSYIGYNDIVNAIAAYKKCVQLLNQIPDGFLMIRNSTAMRILDIYKTLSIETEVTSLQKRLGHQIPNTTFAAKPQPFKEKDVVVKPMLLPPLKQAASSSNSNLRKSSAQKQVSHPAALHKIAHTPIIKKELSEKRMLLHKNKERARKNIEKGFYNQAWKELDEVLHIEPSDAEAKALRAKIKTLQ